MLAASSRSGNARSLCSSSALGRLLGSAEAEFFARVYQQRSLHVSRAGADLAQVFGDAARFDLDALLSWRGVVQADAATRDARGHQVQQSIAEHELRDYYARGWTLCADVGAHEGVARCLASFTESFVVPEGLGFAKAYASPPGAGFALHADAHEVFVLQLAGEKRWRYGAAPALPAPAASFKVEGASVVYAAPLGGPVLDDQGAPLAAARDEELLDVVLEPGQVLYLPAGTWHRTEALSESLALSVSPPLLPARDVALSLLAELLDTPAWRLSVNGPDAIDALGARLSELASTLAQMDRRSLLRAYAARAATRRALLDAGPTPSEEQGAPLSRGTLLARTSSAPMMVTLAPDEAGQEAAFFYQHAEELALPGAAHLVLRALCRCESFTLEEALAWDPSLREDTLHELLSALLGAGVLRRVA